MAHNTGREGIEHTTYVDGGFQECWCMAECCTDPESGSCICTVCCCESDEYWDLMTSEND